MSHLHLDKRDDGIQFVLITPQIFRPEKAALFWKGSLDHLPSSSVFWTGWGGGGAWALIVAVAAEEEQRDLWAVTQSAGGALPPSDTDLLDNFTAVSSVMGQDKLPAPQWLSWLLGRTGLPHTGTVCFIAFVQCVFLLEVPVLSCLSAIIIF